VSESAVWRAATLPGEDRGGADTARAAGSAAFCRLCNLLHHFDKMVQKIVISGNCLQFPEIPAKFREIFTEKAAISIDFQQNLEKIHRNY
jgi:hypothetical protein